MFKKRFISLTIIIMLSMILTSCIERKSNNDKIQLWFLDFYTKNIPYMEKNKSALKIIDNAKIFCEENNIPLEIFYHTFDEITLEDYILKRNLAATNGNIIIIDNIQNLHDLANHHTDYTKLKNYENLLDIYKGGFCIPLCIKDNMDRINNELLGFYNLSFEKHLITYSEYLDIKQKLKEKGARFELNREEFFELLDYYLCSNELLFINENNKIIDDDSTFKKVLKKILLDTCNDIKYNYDSNDFKNIYDNNDYKGIKDKISGITFNEFFIQEKLMEPTNDFGHFDILNKTYLMSHIMYGNNPSFFMHKKITNDKIYDLANYIVSEEMYLSLNKDFEFLPIFKLEKTKDILMLDDNNKYVGNAIRSKEVNEFINTRYDMLLNKSDVALELTNNYFSNDQYKREISVFILESINDIAKKLSIDELSLENFNPNSEELNNMIDKKIDEFVFNIKLYYK